jgi:hypothetical protein
MRQVAQDGAVRRERGGRNIQLCGIQSRPCDAVITQHHPARRPAAHEAPEARTPAAHRYFGATAGARPWNWRAICRDRSPFPVAKLYACALHAKP